MDTVISTLTAEDTQEITIPTRAIVMADFQHGNNMLDGHLVQYAHHSNSRKLYYGHIAYVTSKKFGVAIYVKPLDGYREARLVKSFVMNDVRLVVSRG